MANILHLLTLNILHFSLALQAPVMKKSCTSLPRGSACELRMRTIDEGKPSSLLDQQDLIMLTSSPKGCNQVSSSRGTLCELDCKLLSFLVHNIYTWGCRNVDSWMWKRRVEFGEEEGVESGNWDWDWGCFCAGLCLTSCKGVRDELF